MQTPNPIRHRRSSLILIAWLALVAALSTACTPTPSEDAPPRRPPSAEDQLFSTTEALARDIEWARTSAFTDKVSDRYQPSVLSLKSDLDEALYTWTDYRFELEGERAYVEGERGTLVVRWRRQRTRRSDGHRELVTGRTDLQFTREDGSWKLSQQVGDTLFGK